VKARTRHGLFLTLAVPALAGAGIGTLSWMHLLTASRIRALAWAVVAVGLHAGLGWALWRRTSGIGGSGVARGISILLLRFAAGAGLFATGIVANRGSERVFVAVWSGIFLILLISESIFFVQGVQEL